MRIFPSLVIVFAFFFWGCAHPTDSELEERFKSNREEFSMLAKMLSQDSNIVRLSHKNVFYETESAEEISEGRLKIYRNLLTRLKVKGGVSRANLSRVNLVVSSKIHLLLPFSNSTKSYVYTTDALTPIVESLDERSSTAQGRTYYRKLDDNWYLEYEEW